MKKIFIFSVIMLLAIPAIQAVAQSSVKQKTDTVKACKPSKSGKHCSKPVN